MTSTIALGSQIGESTHHHDHAITPASFRPTNRTNKSDGTKLVSAVKLRPPRLPWSCGHHIIFVNKAGFAALYDRVADPSQAPVLNVPNVTPAQM